MGKTKPKKRSRANNKIPQKNLRLLGVSFIVMGIAIAYSAFYIITNSNDNTNDNTNTKSSSIFRRTSTTLLDHCAGVCNQVASNPGDMVIHYNGDIMVSGAGQWDGNNFPKSKDKNVNIPAGTYTVKLESYDNFVGREDDPETDQSQEQYYVMFKHGNSELARTGITNDLRDGVEEAGNITFTNKKNSPIVLNDDVDKITIVHAGPSSQVLKNGFEPVCMLLEKIEAEPTCGNGTKEGDEECDDGNTTNGDGCSSTCNEEVTASCGDGNKDFGEQCDDGNNTNGDGCSASCKTEKKEEKKKEKKEEKDDCDASIGNYIWYDTNGNGVQEDIEEGIEGVTVCAYNGNDKECDTTNKSGKYKIKDLCAHTYNVIVKNTKGMIQTYDPDGKKDNQTKVKLKEGDKHTKADFGYRGAAPSTGLTTNIALLIGISTLITIGILMVMKKKGAL